MQGLAARTGLLVAVLAAAAVLTAGGAGAQRLEYEGTLRGARGTYTLGDDITSIIFVNQLTASGGGWFAQLSLPVIWQDSSQVPYVAGLPMPGMGSGMSGGGDGHHGGHHMAAPVEAGPGPGGGEYGVGDPYIRAGMALFRDAFDRSTAAVFAAFKPPLASDSTGFGTGEWDTGVGATWSMTRPGWWLVAEATYWRVGDPAGFDLDDAVAYELTSSWALGRSRYAAEVSLWGSSGVVPGVPGPAVASFALVRDVAPRQAVLVAVEAGLTRSAPDLSLAVGWRVAFR